MNKFDVFKINTILLGITASDTTQHLHTPQRNLFFLYHFQYVLTIGVA
jgi:hypothetical protein